MKAFGLPDVQLQGAPMPPHVETDWGIQGVLVMDDAVVVDFTDGGRAILNVHNLGAFRGGHLAGQLNCLIAFHDFGRGVPFGFQLASRN